MTTSLASAVETRVSLADHFDRLSDDERPAFLEHHRDQLGDRMVNQLLEQNDLYMLGVCTKPHISRQVLIPQGWCRG